MSAVIPATCCCGSLSPEVTFCLEHHRYFRSGAELASVTRVLRSVWPVKPDFSAADPAVIENARERGVEVDALFCRYVEGKLQAVPAGTRRDSWELLEKLIKWWDNLGVKAQTQVILADNEVAGTCDLKLDTTAIWDLKCTYDIEPIYPVQLGMYGILEAMSSKLPDHLAIVHCTKRFVEPKLIDVPVREAVRDAELVRDMYRLVNRRGGFTA
jgi:hypothetical protein